MKIYTIDTMKVDPEQIRLGRCDGKRVYICDARLSDQCPLHKPIKILPQEALIRNNQNIMEDYEGSQSHFVVLNKKGVPSKTLKIYIKGKPIQCYDNWDECRLVYQNLLERCTAELTKFRHQVDNTIVDLIQKLKESDR